MQKHAAIQNHETLGESFPERDNEKLSAEKDVEPIAAPECIRSRSRSRLPCDEPCANFFSMPRHRVFQHRAGCATFRVVVFAAFLAALALVSLAAAANDRVRIEPKFTAGQTLRYQVETRTTTTGKTITPIENPEGETKVSQTIKLLVRLDVFGVQPGAASVPGKVHLNALFEQSQATTDRDAVNPDAPSPDAQVAQLQGHSIQFTLGPGGELSDFQGSEDLLPNSSDADTVLSWAKSLTIAARFPREGIAIGQKWSAETPLVGLPLADLMWRTESTYLRNEPCGPSQDPDADASATSSAATTDPAPSSSPVLHDMCAVVLTRFDISRRNSDRSEATPEDYLRNGLRTSGTWTGSGESLDSISLSSGLLVSSTQTGTQDMDYQIDSTKTSSHIHHTGHVENQAQINLVSSPH